MSKNSEKIFLKSSSYYNNLLFVLANGTPFKVLRIESDQQQLQITHLMMTATYSIVNLYAHIFA